MAKQIRDFLHPKHEWKEEHRDYYLDDVVENNPAKICPRCNYADLEVLHTHNVDGTDYRCRNCDLTYTIWLDEI